MHVKTNVQVLGDIVSTANSILEPRRVLNVIMSQIQELIPSEAWSIPKKQYRCHWRCLPRVAAVLGELQWLALDPQNPMKYAPCG